MANGKQNRPDVSVATDILGDTLAMLDAGPLVPGEGIAGAAERVSIAVERLVAERTALRMAARHLAQAGVLLSGGGE